MIAPALYDIDSAIDRVAPFVDRTPVIRARQLESGGGRVFLKAENLQRTGSFKVRGAANALAGLSQDARDRGAVTCSSGNHGKAVAYVAQRLKIPATICVPEWVDPVKVAGMEEYGANIVRHGATYDEAERRSFELKEEKGLTYISAFDDPAIIAGQGTIGAELDEQIPDLDTVFVPLSGGGLIAGIALALQSRRKATIVAVSANNARVMFESVRAGTPISMEEETTIANALSGGIGPKNLHTFGIVGDLVDRHVLVSEEQIAGAMAFAAREYRLILEGGGAAALAALLQERGDLSEKCVVVVLSGGNVDLDLWSRIVSAGPGRNA